ncbi:hypothetical protein RHMOL_Rhmol10G0072500 [Rhododendron molle]|uniref:Uncharacterized protein n=1 Tax=Rhododendron molle TaxID=49168 RepID=A0ACC0M1K1_RHOML|nr:hypothetical protein RHMOL_Rhmol10G0072500 [Rhododendron molle]
MARFDRSWLEPLLKPDFVNPSCKLHALPCCHFCIDCTGISFCEQCEEIELHHEGHQTLRIYSASRSAALRIADIRQLLDISNIHPFVVNDHPIMYLSSRSQGNRQESPPRRSNKCNKCAVCRWPLASANLFCSIGCKVPDKGRSRMSLRLQTAEEVERKLLIETDLLSEEYCTINLSSSDCFVASESCRQASDEKCLPITNTVYGFLPSAKGIHPRGLDGIIVENIGKKGYYIAICSKAVLKPEAIAWSY